MDVVTGVELECSYGAGDGRTRSGVASMPKERSGSPRLDRSCDWEKYGYDTTGVSLFFANKGYHPNISVYPECDMTSTRACDYAVDLKSLHQYLHEEMANAQLRYQGLADAKHTLAPDFKVVGNQVYIKAKYFQSTQPSKTLSEKNLGPYTIIVQVGSLSFTLRLPDSMHTVHPIFHVSQLELAIPNTILDQIQPPPPPVKVDGEPEFKISEILDSKVNRRQKTCKLLYLV